MGRARQKRRRQQHSSGALDERKKLHAMARRESTQPFDVRIYFRFPESGGVRVSKFAGRWPVAERLEELRKMIPEARIVCVKKHPPKKWVKPEHPKAMKERLERESWNG